MTFGPKTAAGDAIHAMKYRSENEDFREAMNRFAFGTKDSDAHYHQIREIILDMRFMGGGRTQNAVGSSRETTPFNCYVSGTIQDSAVHGEGCIFDRVKEAFATMRMGGGIGYDFSTLRPFGDAIRKLGSVSSGPLSFIDVFNATGLAAASAGHRRGAQMAVMRVDHPDIEAFVLSKQNNHRFTGFNISVAVTDEFMEAVYGEKDFDLRWGGSTYRTIAAVELWEKIMRATYDFAEPGILFIDRVNQRNNLYYCETIAATNPCGEQPLPPFGACLLGSFNLVKYLTKLPGARDATTPAYGFSFDQLKADIPIVVRAVDNIIDRARYPLPQQKLEAMAKRRMGLGITALANAGEAMGLPYGTPGFIEFEEKVLETIALECYRAGVMLAKEKGAFPLFDAEKYAVSGFAADLPSELKKDIWKYGIRNSHYTSIAPTGTISMAADNISSGLEPVFSYAVDRPINTPTGQQIVRVEDYGVAFLGTRGRLADETSAAEHIAVLVAAQRHVDSAVSKTVNMDGRTMAWPEFQGLYRSAYDGGAKGCTTFNKSGLRIGLLKDAGEGSPEPAVPEGATCSLDPVTGLKECG